MKALSLKNSAEAEIPAEGQKNLCVLPRKTLDVSVVVASGLFFRGLSLFS